MPTASPVPAPSFAFYALVRRESDEPDDLRKVVVEASVQRNLSGEFAAQMSALMALDPVDYEAGYQASPEEVLRVAGFGLSEPLEQARRLRENAEPMDDGSIERIRCIVGVTRETRVDKRSIVLQAFQQRLIIRKGSFRYLFLLDGGTFTVSEWSGITIGKHATGVYRDGALYFTHEQMIRRCVDFDVVFRDATDAEVTAFISSPVLAPFPADTALALADQTARRKIAAIQKRGILRADMVSTIIAAAQKAASPTTPAPITKTQDGRLVLPTEKKAFKLALSVLCDDVYAGPVSGQVFLSNSKRPLVASRSG